MPLANVLLLEDTGQNLEGADMVDIPRLIKERKAKDKARAGKERRTVKGKKPNLKSGENRRRNPDSSSKLAASSLKGATNLLKDIFSDKGESYDGYYDSTGADVREYGDFGGGGYYDDYFSGSDGNFGGEMGIFSDSGFASGFEGAGSFGGFKEGGQIKKKTETKPKPKKRKSKRVVRGVGKAKRGYGKATYSKRMY